MHVSVRECVRACEFVRMCAGVRAKLGCSDRVIKKNQTLILMRFFYNYQCARRCVRL